MKQFYFLFAILYFSFHNYLPHHFLLQFYYFLNLFFKNFCLLFSKMSDVWKYFEKVKDDDNIILSSINCQLCKAVYVISTATTSSPVSLSLFSPPCDLIVYVTQHIYIRYQILFLFFYTPLCFFRVFAY